MIHTIANVIFPAFSAPYVSALLFPVAGISLVITEILILKITNRSLSWGKIISLVLIMNVASTIIGFIITGLLPSGLEPKLFGEGEHQVAIQQPGENFNTFMIMGFFVAYVLSIFSEYVIAKLIKKIELNKPFQNIALANTGSYIVLFAVAYIWANYIW